MSTDSTSTDTPSTHTPSTHGTGQDAGLDTVHPVDLSGVVVGDELPALTVHLTRPDVVRYSGASTDLNPIHYSDRHAAAIGLRSVVAHGMWTMGTALRVVTDWCGDPARVRQYSVRFTRPVFVPDTDEGTAVVFTGRVARVEDGIATVQLTATCDDDQVLGAAKAEVRLA